ncbi:MAG: division plane positioning ATPase MipZ [Pikeienuella sp.]|uniref:division plane positioning ATPase MipZ n=1 Tax=Pikeienuella sp. TaxID=2831957 RepID=UPI003918E726
MAKVLTFAQQKGGAGKTTLLAQVAVALLGSHRPALIDLDPQRTLTGWMDERIRRTGEAGMDLTESSEWRVGADISKAARDADLIFIDCPGVADVMLNRVLRETDLVIVPAQPSAPDVWATRATLRMAAKQGTDARVVLNRVPPRGSVIEEMAAQLEAEGADLLPERIGNRVAFAAAFAAGAGVTETAKGSRAAEEIEALAASILRILG